MCGRFALAASEEELKRHFGLRKGCIMQSRYNISPGLMIPAIKSPGTQIDFFKWGFVPYWMKKKEPSDFVGYINARAETLLEKPTFKAAFLRQRCIIPATGYYEWKDVKDKKQPYYISLRTSPLFGFAGLWDTWQDENGNRVDTCAIITTPAAYPFLQALHDRMPLILPEAYYASWLAVKTPQATLETLLTPDLVHHSDVYSVYPISNSMNNPRFDTAQCLQPL